MANVATHLASRTRSAHFASDVGHTHVLIHMCVRVHVSEPLVQLTRKCTHARLGWHDPRRRGTWGVRSSHAMSFQRRRDGSLQQQLLQMWPKPKNAEYAHCAGSISRTGDSCAMKLNRSTQGYILGAPIEFHRVAIARSRDGARTIMKIRSFLTPSIAPV